jgi:glc operon protein GlcG
MAKPQDTDEHRTCVEGSMKSWKRRAAVAVAVMMSGTVAAVADDHVVLEKKVLSLVAARTITAAAESAANARGVGVVIVVVDDAGNIIQLTRMDTAQVASVNVGIGKARTAAIYRRPSRDFEEQIKNGRVAALALADATPLQGGVPILVDGKVVGAVGVSGDTPQVDEDIASAGARAIR